MPSQCQQLLDDINKKIENDQERFQRPYVGASSIGEKCERKLQYMFRSCVDHSHDALTLKRFDDGHKSEAIYIDRIKNAGYDLQHEEDGKQYGFASQGGWFKGHRDGFFFNLPFLDNKPAIWEHKASKKWEKMISYVEKDESSALLKFSETYYVQAQLYMGHEGVDSHVTTVSSEGSRGEAICLTTFDKKAFDEAELKANRIITSDRLLPKICRSKEKFPCTFCDVSDVCHDRKIPKPNCRNCAFIDFETDGNMKAICERWSSRNDKGEMVSASVIEGDPSALLEFRECHAYMPDLIADSDDWVEPIIKKEVDKQSGMEKIGLLYDYGNVKFVNGQGEGAYSSMDMYLSQGQGRVWESEHQKIAEAFGGKVINYKVKE